MFNSKYFALVMATAVLIFGAQSMFAQNTAPVRGSLKMQKKDGTQVPVPDALIEVYRTDLSKGALPSNKTDKRGEFAFVNFQLGYSYALAFSAPGMSPIVKTVKPGQDDVNVIANEGDGRKPTEEEVRAYVARVNTPGSDAEAKKQATKEDEEYQKKLAAYNAEKKKAEDANKIESESLKDGAAAFQAKNYDLALEKFDAGYQADPDFEGSAPIFLRNKSLCYRERALATYRESLNGDAAAKAAAMEKVKSDFAQATASLDKASDLLDKAAAGTDVNLQNSVKQTRMDASREYVVLDGLIAKLALDPAKTADAQSRLDKYLPLETDEARKESTLMTWANYMRESGQTKQAIYAYRIILEKTPDSMDAMAGIGLSLFAEGAAASPENKDQEQEGMNYLQKFADGAPDSHPLKTSVKESLDYLKNTAKLTPQKVTPTKAPPKKKP
jgi:tetratricopeptide (TPR) repeat protein